ncbi:MULTISPECIES: HNH endonuclease [Arcobacteraceae]|uniref:HTH HARE-type domain-containing protein n=2 Tax=Arcobacteraceae TaxID=2808963 RepID=A0A837JEN6_9BACT|nr:MULTISPECIES: HNH endonuclease [Arcobacteraceae]KLE06218.1 hypothetical protein AF77_02685 [Aliarcobacter butzleri L352]KLE08198.1 hypothetical protein AF79_08785 [Aliarcobacter butzleri L354]MCG3659766.1 HNH endonuclease [Aliarcobacter butzleri]MCT7589964.1 HNH endonuclease [Aliarcobacter butzleri]MDN5072248.1 HNH endonuclease [Aliarcobacter butzleri]
MEKNIVYKDLTYSEAIEKVIFDNGGYASLKYIYENIEKYRKKTGLTPDNTIQERVQRDNRFTRIAKGVYALTDFVNTLENNNDKYIEFSENEVVLKPIKKIETEKTISQKIRIGQNDFRQALLKSLKKCPITHLDEKRLLIASHIKPWVYCDNNERLDINNGFLLSPLFDKLFDKSVGLITFTSEKEILISNKLSKENIKRLGIKHRQIINDLPLNGREEFLEYHRKYIFQG